MSIQHQKKASIVVPRAISPSATIKCYVSTSPVGIEVPENEQLVTKVNDLLYESIFNVAEGTYYVLVVYQYGEYTNSLTADSFHYSVAQVELTIKNIVAPNFKVFTDPQMVYIHGSLAYNGYLYCSTRGIPIQQQHLFARLM